VPASALTNEAEETAVRTGNRALLNRLQFARGLNALGVGRPETAFAELRRMLDSTDLAFQRSQAVCGVGYLAESATTETERDEARTLLAQVETLTRHTPASGVRRAVVLAQAVLAPDDLAEQRFREATAWMAGAAPWYRARLDLALGGWLRRQDRTTESRRALRSAWAVFRALDTPAWATRAEHELTALEPSGDRSLPGRQALSGQETQVARLAAAGLSNREIAEQLHLSTRTVASHLYRIFPKLGVRSRTQLHLALDDRVQAWSSARRRDH
jgi:ATP/maltotriose-dependent transcriptional regulator MalT